MLGELFWNTLPVDSWLLHWGWCCSC